MGLGNELPRIVRWAVWAVVVIVAVSLVAGVIGALFGGRLTDLGSGAGGLYGVPAVLLDVVAVAIGVPAAVIVSRQPRADGSWIRAAVVVGGGLWAITIGYYVIAHLIDPCANGWWGPDSRIGSQPLCEQFGAELSWHTRFHLVAHATPAVALVAIYTWSVRRWVAHSDDEHTESDSGSPSS